MSLNRWVGMGRITKDIEKKVTPSGISVVNFSIAVEDDYKPKDGTDRQVYFVECEAWGHNADFLEKYCGKGRNIVVVGMLKSDKYTDRDGNNRTAWRIKVDTVYFADSKRSDQSGAEPTAAAFTDVTADGGDLPF